MKVVYISGKYSADTIHETVRNIRRAESVAIQWWQRGDCAVICPHLNSALFDGAVDYETAMQGYLELVRRCDVIVMLPRWQQSPGAVREHQLAQDMGKKVVYA